MKDDSIFNDPEMKDFLEQFEEGVLPNIKASAFVLIIYSDKPDAKLCLEVGAAVLLEKPLLLCVQQGAYVPPFLTKLATRIVKVEKNLSEETKQRVVVAVADMVAELERRQQ